MLSELSDWFLGDGQILCHPRDEGAPNIIEPVPPCQPRFVRCRKWSGGLTDSSVSSEPLHKPAASGSSGKRDVLERENERQASDSMRKPLASAR
jgi:hypothetical protein